MELLDRINELCKEKGISRRQMEKEAGLGTGSTSKWKGGFRPNQASMSVSLLVPFVYIGTPGLSLFAV